MVGGGTAWGPREHRAPWVGAARSGDAKGVQVVLSSRMLLLGSCPPRASRGMDWKELEALGRTSGFLLHEKQSRRPGRMAETLRASHVAAPCLAFPLGNT